MPQLLRLREPREVPHRFRAPIAEKAHDHQLHIAGFHDFYQEHSVDPVVDKPQMRRPRVDPRVQRQQHQIQRGGSPNPELLRLIASLQSNNHAIRFFRKTRQRRSHHHAYPQSPRESLPKMAIWK